LSCPTEQAPPVPELSVPLLVCFGVPDDELLSFGAQAVTPRARTPVATAAQSREAGREARFMA
jgi:hypothetical protein